MASETAWGDARVGREAPGGWWVVGKRVEGAGEGSSVYLLQRTKGRDVDIKWVEADALDMDLR